MRVKECLPDVKVLFTLRNPVDRAVSHYKWMHRVGLEVRDATEAFRYDAERVHLEKDQEYLREFSNPLHFDFDHIHRSYLRRSYYHTQVERWLEHIPSSNIRVVQSERLFKNTGEVLKRISEFLGVEYIRKGDLSDASKNKSGDHVAVDNKDRAVAEQALSDVDNKLEEVIDPHMVVGAKSMSWNTYKSQGGI
jgi:transposase